MLLASVVNLDHRDTWVPPVFPVLRAHLVYQVSRVSEGHLGSQERKANRGLQGPLDIQERWAPLVCLD